MNTVEQVTKAIKSVDDLCGHCPVCSAECPIAIARRALEGYKYDLQTYYQSEQEN